MALDLSTEAQFNNGVSSELPHYVLLPTELIVVPGGGSILFQVSDMGQLSLPNYSVEIQSGQFVLRKHPFQPYTDLESSDVPTNLSIDKCNSVIGYRNQSNLVTLDYEVPDKTCFPFGVENGPSQKAHSGHQNGTSFPERSPAKPEAMQVLSLVEQPLDATLPRLQPQKDSKSLPKVVLDPSKTVDTSVLNQLVCQLLEQNGCSLKAPTSTPPTSTTSAEDLILSGHNLSALARFVHRLRQYRLRAGLSQNELSAELARHFNNETMFSQSLLSRFERLEVNVRAAFRLLPYLESWLSHTEQKGCSLMSSESIQPDITLGKRVSGRTRTTQLIRLDSISNNLGCSSDQRPHSSVDSPVTGGVPHTIAVFSQSSEKGFDSTSADVVPTTTCQLKNPECRTKRRKRTHFSDYVLTILSEAYKEDPRPEGAKLTRLAMETGYDREAIRVWFCNRRQVSARTEKVST
ncbi:hypothetical protein T265_13340 [Opisthorchis viverrini]|uniref:Homeobox domain protein n=2 Tax=Opisthorchis viverrini TaxID=6198 RepID=A0A074ZQX2_OPIVI|nr:hypothetical protein T265_13340 [Opisthorchis viverrini]KER29531.1 hypothetical protein T265_13340 [Opisthorchis viverrini]